MNLRKEKNLCTCVQKLRWRVGFSHKQYIECIGGITDA